MNDQEKKEREDLACRGIDYDLRWCLRENPQGVFDINDIGKVLAVWEGANDEEEWVWILALKDPIFKEHEPSEKHVTPGNVTAEYLLDPLLMAIPGEPSKVLLGRFVLLKGGCDYTGWDCQSFADHAIALTAVSAINTLFEWYDKLSKVVQNDREARHLHTVHTELLRQLHGGKKMTWREQRDLEFGIGG